MGHISKSKVVYISISCVGIIVILGLINKGWPGTFATNEIISALIGSAFAGLFTATATVYSLRETFAYQNGLADKQKLQADQSKAIEIIIGMEHGLGLLGDVDRSISEDYREHDDPDAESWHVVQSIVNLEVPEHFYPPQSVSFLLEGKKFELAQELLLLQRRALSCLQSMRTYSEIRDTAIGLVSPSGTYDGTRGAGVVKEENVGDYQRATVRLNHLIGRIIEDLEETIKDYKALLPVMSQALRELFGPDFIAIKTV